MCYGTRYYLPFKEIPKFKFFFCCIFVQFLSFKKLLGLFLFGKFENKVFFFFKRLVYLPDFLLTRLSVHVPLPHAHYPHGMRVRVRVFVCHTGVRPSHSSHTLPTYIVCVNASMYPRACVCFTQESAHPALLTLRTCIVCVYVCVCDIQETVRPSPHARYSRMWCMYVRTRVPTLYLGSVRPCLSRRGRGTPRER